MGLSLSAQCAKQSIFPTRIVDLPTDLSFVTGTNRFVPDRPVAFVFSNIQAIYDRHASREITSGFYLDVMLARCGGYGGVESNAHRDRIGKADPVFAGLGLVSCAGVTVALDGKAGNAVSQTLHAADVIDAQHGFAPAELPAHKFDWKPAAHHQPCGLRVDPQVVLGSRRDVSFAAR